VRHPNLYDRFTALASAATAEQQRRQRRAFLLALGAGMLAVFSLGASIVPVEIATNLLLSYLVFLLVFGVVMAYGLMGMGGARYRDALAVSELAHRRTIAEWRRATGGDPPRSPTEADAWLAANPETEVNRRQRFSAQLRAGQVAAARETLARFPRETPYDRYWLESDKWFLSFVEGELPDPAPIAAEVAAIETPELRAHGEAGLAVALAHRAAAQDLDWIDPLASARPKVAAHVDDTRVLRVEIVAWSLLMAIASGLIGVALLVGRLTSVWR
jgi:hypothetical protein